MNEELRYILMGHTRKAFLYGIGCGISIALIIGLVVLVGMNI